MVKQKKEINPHNLTGQYIANAEKALKIAIICIPLTLIFLILLAVISHTNQRLQQADLMTKKHTQILKELYPQQQITPQQKAYVDFIFTPKMISTNYNTIILITDNQTIILKRTQ